MPKENFSSPEEFYHHLLSENEKRLKPEDKPYVKIIIDHLLYRNTSNKKSSWDDFTDYFKFQRLDFVAKFGTSDLESDRRNAPIPDKKRKPLTPSYFEVIFHHIQRFVDEEPTHDRIQYVESKLKEIDAAKISQEYWDHITSLVDSVRSISQDRQEQARRDFNRLFDLYLELYARYKGPPPTKIIYVYTSDMIRPNCPECGSPIPEPEDTDTTFLWTGQCSNCAFTGEFRLENE